MASLTCPECLKKYNNVSAKNKHIRKMHANEVQIEDKTSHIYCPLCADEDKQAMANYIALIEHFRDQHNILIEEEKLTFSSLEYFENWMKLEYRNVDYITNRTSKRNYKTVKDYYCNRSNTRAFKSNCTKILMKKGGSIKINGICPSRITAHFYNEGNVDVHFIKTHVGHEIELRTRRLTPGEKNEIGEKLKAGVSPDRIVRDAHKVKNGKMERINLLRMEDLRYHKEKNGIGIRRDPNEAIATSIEVQERNLDGRNYAISKAHKNAEQRNLNDDVKQIEFGKFQVRSSTSGEKFYSVVYGGIGICKCARLLCRVCNICKHKYVCECSEYAVKNIMCKHVHMVSLYERGVLAKSVLGEEVENEESENFCIEEKLKLGEAANEFLEEKCQDLGKKENAEENIDDETQINILLNDLINNAKTLNIEDIKILTTKWALDIRELTENISTKRKMEKRTYPQPQKKQRKE